MDKKQFIQTFIATFVASRIATWQSGNYTHSEMVAEAEEQARETWAVLQDTEFATDEPKTEEQITKELYKIASEEPGIPMHFSAEDGFIKPKEQYYSQAWHNGYKAAQRAMEDPDTTTIHINPTSPYPSGTQETKDWYRGYDNYLDKELGLEPKHYTKK